MQPGLAPANGGGVGLVYRETIPPARIADEVACFWTIRSRIRLTTPFTYHVVPDGCVDVLTDLTGGDTWIYGPRDVPFTVSLEGNVALFGIRIRPGRFPRLFGLASDELAHVVARLGDVVGDRTANQFIETLESTGDDVLRIAAAADVLAANRRRMPPRADFDAAVVDAITASGGTVAVGTLASRFGVTSRRVTRACTRAVGLPPKRLARIVRFQQTLARLLAPDLHSLADLAAELGYYDQSHLTNEVRVMMGRSPSDFSKTVSAARTTVSG